MLIISDNSAVPALAETGLLEILPELFGRITLTESVRRECQHPRAPAALRDWIASPPPWLSITPDPAVFLPETANLGAGEASAISLAWAHRDDCCLLILDEKRGRRVAAALSLPMNGVISILGHAARKGLVDFNAALGKMAAFCSTSQSAEGSRPVCPGLTRAGFSGFLGALRMSASRVIFHLDTDAFYASVEQRERPEWRGKPAIMGGSLRIPEGPRHSENHRCLCHPNAVTAVSPRCPTLIPEGFQPLAGG